MIDTNKKFIFNMEELKTAQFPLDELFSLQVNHNNVKYEFLVRFSSTIKNLICFGSGAYDPKRENISPPIYRRHSWQNVFEESVIYYNDPTLYNDLNLGLGWGVGKNEEWYLPVIADIIRILAKKNGTKPENILFFGSSGGGFTAIILSTFIKNSTVMINNPQIRLTKWKGLFNTMIEKCFDNTDLETILKEYGYRFDVIELFKREKYMPPITYIVNINSKDDILNHFTHFINSLASFEYFNEQVNILIYQDEKGHDGIYSTQKTIKMIKNHFNVNYPPVMKSIEPVDNELNVSTGKVIKIIFDKPVKVGNNWIELKNSSGEVIPVKTNIKDNALIITPEKLLKEGQYKIILHTGCITDWVNNPIKLITSNFTVEIPSKIISTDPVNNTVNVPQDKIIKDMRSPEMDEFIELEKKRKITMNHEIDSPQYINKKFRGRIKNLEKSLSQSNNYLQNIKKEIEENNQLHKKEIENFEKKLSLFKSVLYDIMEEFNKK